VRAALERTSDNHERVFGCVKAYFDFVADPSGAYRLIFESDLRNEPSVRERVERSLQLSVEAIADTIARDTGLQRDDAELLSCGLAGVAEVSARWWLSSTDRIPKERAVELIQALVWRGISGYPRMTDAVQ
jgi:AcrR family transcriptional regulator